MKIQGTLWMQFTNFTPTLDLMALSADQKALKVLDQNNCYMICTLVAYVTQQIGHMTTVYNTYAIRFLTLDTVS